MGSIPHHPFLSVRRFLCLLLLLLDTHSKLEASFPGRSDRKNFCSEGGRGEGKKSFFNGGRPSQLAIGSGQTPISYPNLGKGGKRTIFSPFLSLVPYHISFFVPPPPAVVVAFFLLLPLFSATGFWVLSSSWVLPFFGGPLCSRVREDWVLLLGRKRGRNPPTTKRGKGGIFHDLFSPPPLFPDTFFLPC